MPSNTTRAERAVLEVEGERNIFSTLTYTKNKEWCMLNLLRIIPISLKPIKFHCFFSMMPFPTFFFINFLQLLHLPTTTSIYIDVRIEMRIYPVTTSSLWINFINFLLDFLRYHFLIEAFASFSTDHVFFISLCKI